MESYSGMSVNSGSPETGTNEDMNNKSETGTQTDVNGESEKDADVDENKNGDDNKDQLIQKDSSKPNRDMTLKSREKGKKKAF